MCGPVLIVSIPVHRAPHTDDLCFRQWNATVRDDWENRLGLRMVSLYLLFILHDLFY